MSKTAYQKTLLTGGVAAALDGIDGAGLLDGDFAFVMAGGVAYTYVLDDDSAATESSPGVIAPDTNPGDKRWILQRQNVVDYAGSAIGVAGAADFGVGVCPLASLPPGMTPLAGYNISGHSNYGNYQFSDGSIMVFVPKFYYKITTLTIDIKGTDTYADTAAANAAGYALHRAFIDGGVEQPGFFVDKYMCSKNAWGTGYVASSIPNGLPLSSAAAHNPFSGCTGGADFYYSAIDLPHRRDGVNGNVNASSNFFCCSRFIHAALAMLSMAHGQASGATTHCAWYHATYNYPKGLNKNTAPVATLIDPADNDDAALTYISDGYSNCGKTGSGSPFAKTTHNGQTCGVCDLNGLMYEISSGLTCIAPAAVAIEGMSRAAACEITWTAHGLATDDYVQILAITQADWSGCKDKMWKITKTGDNTFTIAFNSSAFGTAYDAGTDPGTITKGFWYVAKQATSMKDFTSGNAAATDHWGATGVAAMMERFYPAFESAGVFAQRMGSGGNQVLSAALTGNGWLLASMGFPKDDGGIDTTGTDLFGKDYFYQYIVNEMCMIACAHWSDASTAGVWSVYWNYARTYSSSYIGLRAACYPV